MAIQEALSIVIKKNKLAVEYGNGYKTSTYTALKYLFDCYSRIEVEEHQYPKVRKIQQK